MYTLYHSTGTCSLAIKAALTMTGVPFETKVISLAKGEHQTPEYLKINPMGKVPAITKGDNVLTEGLAIQLYLAEQFPNSQLLPTDQPQRAQAFRWLAFLYGTVHPCFSRLFHAERYGENTDDIKVKAEAQLFEMYGQINDQLSKTPYIAGDQLTAADLYLLVTLHWRSVLSTSLVDEYPALNRYIERILEHPVVGKVFKEELQPSS